MKARNSIISVLLAVLICFGGTAAAQDETEIPDFPQKIIGLFFIPHELWDEAFRQISEEWKPGYTPMAIEMLSLARGEMMFRLLELLRR